jgi:hypothetical protein
MKNDCDWSRIQYHQIYYYLSSVHLLAVGALLVGIGKVKLPRCLTNFTLVVEWLTIFAYHVGIMILIKRLRKYDQSVNTCLNYYKTAGTVGRDEFAVFGSIKMYLLVEAGVFLGNLLSLPLWLIYIRLGSTWEKLFNQKFEEVTYSESM